MLLPLLVVLSAAPTLSDLQLNRRSIDSAMGDAVANGLSEVPLSRYSTRFDVASLPGEVRAALVIEALGQVKEYLNSAAGRASWKTHLTRGGQSVAERSALTASNLAYWTTLRRERRTKLESDEKALARATQQAAEFKRERPRLEREDATRAQAAAAPDEQAFNRQLEERLVYFLEATRRLPFDAALVEGRNGRKLFADPALEAKPHWWKFCFRAGPEATAAARAFATSWLAELRAPPAPSKLSDEK